MLEGVKFTGVPSLSELAGIPGVVSEERFEKGPVAVIECCQEIPCNPCEKSCPFGAITIGSPITNLPAIDGDKCIGCGACLIRCPGLAIFRVHKNHSENTATVSFPYEYYPSPEVGSAVPCGGRDGKYVCMGTVLQVSNGKANDGTTIVKVEVPKEFYNTVRTICRNTPTKHETALLDTKYVCRCEEVTEEEILAAIADGATSVAAVKRRTHAGMGLCQGRTCRRVIQQMLGRAGVAPAAEIMPATTRPPVRTARVSEFICEEDD